MCIEMLHVFQKVETIHKTQTEFCLEYENIHTRYILYKYTFLSPKNVYKRILFTYSYLVCVTAKDARCKLKMPDTIFHKDGLYKQKYCRST